MQCERGIDQVGVRQGILRIERHGPLEHFVCLPIVILGEAPEVGQAA